MTAHLEDCPPEKAIITLDLSFLRFFPCFISFVDPLILLSLADTNADLNFPWKTVMKQFLRDRGRFHQFCFREVAKTVD